MKCPECDDEDSCDADWYNENCQLYQQHKPFDAMNASDKELEARYNEIMKVSEENGQDPCPQLMELGIPCGRELINNPLLPAFPLYDLVP